ncbi:MAG: class I SAM-dependent methyltransferase [Bacteroidales bacterium]|nr:class I SAM-dependent methyltransferase [Bacteroidales bacterium]
MSPLAFEDEKINCPYCQTVSGFDFPFYSRSYYHCPSCDLIFNAREKNSASSVSYYRDHYFDDYAEDQTSGQRTDLYRHILHLLEGYQKPGSLLDAGCGCGFFLKEAKESGWKVAGVDTSRKSIAFATTLVGDGTFFDSLDDVPANSHFDVITMINVLDHMTDAFRQLQKAKDLLSPGGVLYLRFPSGSFHSFFVRLALMLPSKQCMNRFLVFHEYAFTPWAITRILDEMGFVDVKVFNSYITGGNFSSAKLLRSLMGTSCRLLEKLSGGRWLWGPSLEVIVFKEAEVCKY